MSNAIAKRLKNRKRQRAARVFIAKQRRLQRITVRHANAKNSRERTYGNEYVGFSPKPIKLNGQRTRVARARVVVVQVEATPLKNEIDAGCSYDSRCQCKKQCAYVRGNEIGEMASDQTNLKRFFVLIERAQCAGASGLGVVAAVAIVDDVIVQSVFTACERAQ